MAAIMAPPDYNQLLTVGLRCSPDKNGTNVRLALHLQHLPSETSRTKTTLSFTEYLPKSWKSEEISSHSHSVGWGFWSDLQHNYLATYLYYSMFKFRWL